MPYYRYECSRCKVPHSLRYPMGEAANSAPCPLCRGLAERVFTSPQLNTQPYYLHDDNKFALGFDETTRRETMKADDVQYEKQWQGKTPSKPEPPKETLLDTYHKLYGAL